MRRLGLQARIAALFALGALGASSAMAAGSYEVTRSRLVAERERAGVRATLFDAATVQSGLVADDPDIVGVLRSLDTGTMRRPVIRRDGAWYARSTDTDLTRSIPAALRRTVERGEPAAQRTRGEQGVSLVVGVPLPAVDATYYEVVDLSELERTLRSLALVLTLVAAATSLAGALLGAWSARRVLRPLRSVTRAATMIAGGDLAARLDTSREPELGRLTGSFNGMVDELASRLERDRRFAGDVSHELRSPLQTLSAAASVLDRRRDQLDERSGSALDLLVGELERFEQLVTDLLDLARDDEPLRRAPVDLEALLRHVGQERGVQVEVEPGLRAEADVRRLARVLTNLVDNAERHGGGAVCLRGGRDGQAVFVEVDDAGPGVAVEDREVVFDRFGRGRAARTRGSGEGTGLGLAIVAQHLAAHDGSVTVLDRPGGGARFRVRWPA